MSAELASHHQHDCHMLIAAVFPCTCDGEGHWWVRYDPDGGGPFGTSCRCDLVEDHDGMGDLINL